MRGQTDSEHIFALFVENLRKEKISEDTDKPEEVFQVLKATIKQIEQLKSDKGIKAPSLLNLCVTNGCWMTAIRYISDGSDNANTLYYSSGSKYECKDRQCVMEDSSGSERSVLIVSEKLTDLKEDWVVVPINQGLVVDEALVVTLMTEH